MFQRTAGASKETSRDEMFLVKGMIPLRFFAFFLACLVAFSCVPMASFAFVGDQAFAEEETTGGTTGGTTGDETGGTTGGETGGTTGGETGGETGGTTGGETGGTTGGETGGTGGGEQPSSTPKIRDAGIHLPQSNQYLGYATNPNLIGEEIRTKGGTLELQCDVWWVNGSTQTAEPAGSYVTWQSSDPSVATINSTGIVSAVSDGTVEIYAIVDGAYTTSGSDLVASITVDVMGQSDEKYVTDIRIMAPDGTEVGPSAYVIDGDISYTSVHFYASVDVFDPATETTTTYDTSNGSLASQAGISDPTWSVDPPELGSVDELTGQYRALQYGTVFLTVTSLAGFNNERVTHWVGVTAKDPNGGEVEDGYYPQQTISIKAYYELYPPASLSDPNDENFVINKEYDISSLQSLGTTTQVYTAIGTPNYYTFSGYGVYLANILNDSGVNMDGIKGFHFGTQDNVKTTISYSSLFSTRYYYPNIDMGSKAGAVQVAPMIAIESYQEKNGSPNPDYDKMSEATRFRLLIGASDEGGNSQFQIKWINTLYVVLAGGPSTGGDGDGDGDGDGGGTGGGTDPGTGGGDTGGGDTGGGGGSTEPGTDTGGDAGNGGTASGAAPGGQTGTAGVTAVAPSGSAGDSSDKTTSSQSTSAASETADNASAGDAEGSIGESTEQTTAGSSGSPFSVYQVMNANDSVTDTTIARDNPLRKVALPLGAGMLVIGGMESFVWYRRQIRGVPVLAQ